MNRMRQAGWHMRGKTTASPFVSLVEDPAKLAVSRALGESDRQQCGRAAHPYRSQLSGPRQRAE